MGLINELGGLDNAVGLILMFSAIAAVCSFYVACKVK